MNRDQTWERRCRAAVACRRAREARSEAARRAPLSPAGCPAGPEYAAACAAVWAADREHSLAVAADAATSNAVPFAELS